MKIIQSKQKIRLEEMPSDRFFKSLVNAIFSAHHRPHHHEHPAH